MRTKIEFDKCLSRIPTGNRAILQSIEAGTISSNSFSTTHSCERTRAVPLTILAALLLVLSYPVRADWVSLNPGVLGVNNSVSDFATDENGNLYAGGSFTIAGSVVANYIAKWDGTTWSAFHPGPKGQIYALAVSGTNLYAGGYFTNANGSVSHGVVKWDGNTWSALGSGMNGAIYALAASGTNLYAGGGFTNAGGVAAKYVAKWDGSKWSALGSGMDSRVYALAVSGTNLYAGGSFTNAGGLSAVGIAKWDGKNWSAVGSGMGGTLPYVYALAVSGTELYAGGYFTYAGGVSAVGVARWDGNAWSNVGTGLGDAGDYTGTAVYALAASGTNLYAGGFLRMPGGGDIHNGIAEWNGSVWRVLGYVYNNGVTALAVNGTNVYAGGSFELIDSPLGTVTALNIAKWDGNTWAPLISGVNARVCALASNGTNLYAGGDFTHAPGGLAANYIAKWDGDAWSALGSGMNGPVQALAIQGTDLYAGGTFTQAGDTSVNFFAKWDGHAWSALGSGPDGPVYALAASGTNLYAGGSFGVARWDGSDWFAVGGPMSSSVSALAVSQTNLYAGGPFGIAKWDGNTWSVLVSWPDVEAVNALAVSGDDLYVGGRFNTSWANNVAMWDGNAWSALGSGVGVSGGYLYALCADGTNLYAGAQAEFSRAIVAKWNGNTWEDLGEVGGLSTDDTDVETMVVDGRGHLFVGGNFYLAGNITSPFIAQMNLGSAPTVLTLPQTQTAEIGATVDLSLGASGKPAVSYLWFFNETNLVGCGTNGWLELANCDFSQSGTYTVVVTNVFGAVTSAPVMLNVIPPVERRPVPTINLVGEAGTSLNVEFTDALSPPANWLPLDSVNLTNPPQFYFDASTPLPAQRFYRVWQSGTPVTPPSLNLPFMAPAITLAGNIGDSLRLDYINAIGPTDAWVTLDTVTLTNTSQLYFDTSSIGQSRRLYRIVPEP